MHLYDLWKLSWLLTGLRSLNKRGGKKKKALYEELISCPHYEVLGCSFSMQEVGVKIKAGKEMDIGTC